VIQAAQQFTIRKSSTYEQRRASKSTDRTPCTWQLPLVAALFALLPSTAQSDSLVTVSTPSANSPRDQSSDELTRPSLPPRALLRIGTTDLRTQDDIRPLAFSPDGRLIACADIHAPSPWATIFEVQTGRRIKQLIAPGDTPGCVESLAFSPDGSILLWGEMRGEVALWDLASDRLLFRKKLHTSNVMAVRFSPDGRFFASAAQDGVVHLRRIEAPEASLRDLTMPPAPARGDVLAPDRNKNGAAQANRARQDIGCMAFSPDGTRLIVGAQFTAMIAVFRVSDGQLLHQFGPAASNGLHTLSVSPDGRTVLSGGHTMVPTDGTNIVANERSVAMAEVRLWDLETGNHDRNLCGEDELGWGYAAISKDGQKTAIAGFDGVRIVETATGKLQRTISLPGHWGREPVFSPDGTLVALPDLNSVAIFEVSTGRRLHHDAGTPVGSAISAAWSQSGSLVVTGHGDGFVRAWDALTGKLVWCNLLAPVVSPGGLSANPAFVGFSHDGKLVIAAGRRDDPVEHRSGIVAFYDAVNGRLVRDHSQNEIRGAALAADGRMAVLAMADNVSGGTRLVGFEIATGRARWANPPEDPPTPFTHVAAIQFERNSPWFHAALGIGRVLRINSLTGREQNEFLADLRTEEQRKAGEPEWPMMHRATFSPDGSILVSSHTEWVFIWDVASGKMRRKIRHPHGYGCNLALSPDRRTLATSDIPSQADMGKDAIRLFNIASGDQILTLEPSDGRAVVMVFSPDGTKLLTGFGKGSSIVWDVDRETGVIKR
jgi:WD40 repeat protein